MRSSCVGEKLAAPGKLDFIPSGFVEKHERSNIQGFDEIIDMVGIDIVIRGPYQREVRFPL